MSEEFSANEDQQTTEEALRIQVKELSKELEEYKVVCGELSRTVHAKAYEVMDLKSRVEELRNVVAQFINRNQ
jgi:predicted RNase H-like nuclease (RuvC/YqgF family)